MKTKKPKSKRPLGCLTNTGIYMTIATIIVSTVFVLVVGGAVFSPGSLSTKSGKLLGGVNSHAELSRNCGSCHTTPWGQDRLTERCSVCHTQVLEDVQNSTGLHGALMPNITSCQNCHTEHNGANANLTVIDSKLFPHQKATGYALQAHIGKKPLGCSDCHIDGINSFDVGECKSCHSDIDTVFVSSHTANFGKDCLACHDGLDSYGVAFDHNKLDFPLVGKHTDKECKACHLNALTSADLQATNKDCISCHKKDDYHETAFGQNCANCHIPDSWQESTFDHAASLTNFPLIGEHAKIKDCNDCHVNLMLLGVPSNCLGCHKNDDTHNGSFGRDCTKCHTPNGWKDVTIDHSLTKFPLDGKHKQVEKCQDCHINNQFAETSTNCVSCHKDDDYHETAFGQNCANCHIPDSWNESTFDHAASSTNFPLIGEHAKIKDCNDCHVNLMLLGVPSNCLGCHKNDDTHNGSFGQDCIVCHTEVDGWDNVDNSHWLSGSVCKNCHTIADATP